MLDETKLRALAALAEAAREYITNVDDVYRTPIKQPVAEYFSSILPTTTLELVERVLKAEAIVRDLAACDPDGNPNVGFSCSLCGAHTPGMKLEHAESCPWRRAVEAQR